MGDAEETIRMRRNLEGNDYKNSKMWMRRSYSPQCQQYERFKNMVTTNGDDDYGLDDPCFPFTCFNGWGPAVKVAPTPNTATQFMAHPRGAASARTVPQINRFIIYRVQN